MPTEQFQLSPAAAEARFQLLQKRRRWNPRRTIRCSGRSTPTTSGINGEHAASDFRNLRENGLVRIDFALPPNIRLIDPATNLPSAETSVDIWRMVPSVNDVKLTGADGINPWPRGPNRGGGYQLDGRFADLQEQALGALLSHAQMQKPPPQRMLDDLAAFSAPCSRTLACGRCLHAIDAGNPAAARCRSAAVGPRAGRARSCSRARAVIVMAVLANPPRICPW